MYIPGDSVPRDSDFIGLGWGLGISVIYAYAYALLRHFEPKWFVDHDLGSTELVQLSPCMGEESVIKGKTYLSSVTHSNQTPSF